MRFCGLVQRQSMSILGLDMRANIGHRRISTRLESFQVESPRAVP